MQMFLYRPSFTLDLHQLDAQPSRRHIEFAVSEGSEHAHIRIRPILLSQAAAAQQAPVKTGEAEVVEDEAEWCTRKRIALAFDVGRKVCRQRPELRPILPPHGQHLPPVLCYAAEMPEVEITSSSLFPLRLCITHCGTQSNEWRGTGAR
jgi:hypothetical protein